MLRDTSPMLSLFFLLFIGIVMAAPACSSANKRTKTLQTTVTAVNAARDGFFAWDRQHLIAIVKNSSSRDDALVTERLYAERKKLVIDSFEVAYRALAVAATQADDLSFRAAMASAAELLDAIKKLTGGS